MSLFPENFGSSIKYLETIVFNSLHPIDLMNLAKTNKYYNKTIYECLPTQSMNEYISDDDYAEISIGYNCFVLMMKIIETNDNKLIECVSLAFKMKNINFLSFFDKSDKYRERIRNIIDKNKYVLFKLCCYIDYCDGLKYLFDMQYVYYNYNYKWFKCIKHKSEMHLRIKSKYLCEWRDIRDLVVAACLAAGNESYDVLSYLCKKYRNLEYVDYEADYNREFSYEKEGRYDDYYDVSIVTNVNMLLNGIIDANDTGCWIGYVKCCEDLSFGLKVCLYF